MSATRDAGAFLAAYETAFRTLWHPGGNVEAIRDAAEERARRYVKGRQTRRARRRLQERTSK